MLDPTPTPSAKGLQKATFFGGSPVTKLRLKFTLLIKLVNLIESCFRTLDERNTL